MPIKKSFVAVVFAAASVMAAAVQEQPTPYDLIRPVYPLTWDTTVFDHYGHRKAQYGSQEPYSGILCAERHYS